MKGKKLYLAAAICFGLGCCVFLAGLGIAHFDFKNLQTEHYEQKEYTFSDVSDIFCDGGSVDEVIIQPSSDGAVHISCYESDHHQPILSQSSDGKLTLIWQDTEKWLDHWFNVNFQPIQTVISVPTGFSGELSVNTTGRVTANSVTCSALEIETSNGSVEISNFTAEKMTLTSSNASVTLKQTNIQETLNCHTSNGSFRFSDLTAANLQADTSNGSVRFANVNCGESLSVQSSNADVVLTDTYAQGNLKVKSSNGSINFDRLYPGESIDFKTSNAAISGTVFGSLADFSVISETSNANNNLPEHMTAGDKQLTAKTSNGNIKIDFLG